MRSSIVLSLAAATSVSAWGSLGHETVAYIASHYVVAHTKQWAQSILADTSADYLANVATVSLLCDPSSARMETN